MIWLPVVVKELRLLVVQLVVCVESVQEKRVVIALFEVEALLLRHFAWVKFWLLEHAFHELLELVWLLSSLRGFMLLFRLAAMIYALFIILLTVIW